MTRTWKSITIEMTYTYFADFDKPLKIEVYHDGYIYAPDFHQDHDVEITDDVELSDKDLHNLDRIVEQILKVEKVDTHMVMDGPAFECLIYLNTGTVRGISYYAFPEDPKIAELEEDLRKILQEDFFQRKYKKQLSRWPM